MGLQTSEHLDIRLCTQTDISHVLDQYSAVSGELKKIVESAEGEEAEIILSDSTEITATDVYLSADSLY